MESSPAQKAWKREHYLTKRDYYTERDRLRYARFREVIQEAKNRPCADCGHSYPPCVMDFDHRDNQLKLRNVSDLKDFSSEEKLQEEIAKCEVVCANRHRIRTSVRKQYNGNSANSKLQASEA